MTSARERLLDPSGSHLFLTDAGTETCLIYDHGIELPKFASITLMRSESGKETLRKYFLPFPGIAASVSAGLVLETATWRASPDWAAPIGFSQEELDAANVEAVAQLVEFRREFGGEVPIVVSACIGPRGDGYVIDSRMTIEEAIAYHRHQVGVLSQTEADIVGAFTLGYPEEAVGVALASKEFGKPVVLAFTVETDGTLPCGLSLGEAIATVDHLTHSYPSYYLINCAHPDHFSAVLDAAAAKSEPWLRRLRGVRANASRKSHAELDESTELDAGDPDALAAACARLRRRFPWMNVFGGCCGTSATHVQKIAHALTS
jgi:S-methylmethionine-dependent homocysteine/selenocysteine methylase